jgi:hypothetical protein
VNFYLALLSLALIAAVVFLYYRNERDRKLRQTEVEAANLKASESERKLREESFALRQRADAALTEANRRLDETVQSLERESDALRQHYESAARQAEEAMAAQLAAAEQELARLRSGGLTGETEAETRRQVEAAISQADQLRKDAEELLATAKRQSLEERAEARTRAKALQEHAEAMLTEATREARRVRDAAEREALTIGGDAYRALREKDTLDLVVSALRNTIEGYGDRYLVPTRSVLDDLADDFGHTDAGLSLRTARERSRLMVSHGEAASCEYVDQARRATAVRFVIDAFNGRVDAILSRVKHDNHGTLEQEIRDAFSLVNLNGDAFRKAMILPAYLDARLAELKWAVITQELRRKERDEQRRIQEQLRDEERARREYERALRDAARDEENLRKAMEQARAEIGRASAVEQARLTEQLSTLEQKLKEAEARNQRALSMAQQTKAGHVYIISNHGSFGDSVLKIGMTRRLEPLDRVIELGDASVPFPFDVHAMIFSNDAPALERRLHRTFETLRVNKVNYRKEFFRVTLEELRSLITAEGHEVTFTMTAEAHEYRETLALERMRPEERERYLARWDEEEDAE